MVDVETARRKLLEALGEYAEKYWSNMKSWYKQKISKDDFDMQAFELLGPGKINYHNEFIIAILTKCQAVANNTQSHKPSITQGKTTSKPHTKSVHLRKARVKRSAESPTTNVQPFEEQDVMEIVPSIIPKGEDQDVNLCSQDLVLPDISTMHGRLFLGAWDAGLDSSADETAPLLVAAVETRLKNILFACIARRKASKVRLGSHFRYGYGVASIRSDIRNERLAEDVNLTEHRTFDQAEAYANTKLAVDELKDPVLRPISLFDLRDTLQENPHLIPSHSVRAGSMERILGAMWHPSREEIEQNKLYLYETRKVHVKLRQQRGLRV